MIFGFSFTQADPQRAGVNYDKEFIVCSLDLLSGLAEGLGSSIESLVSIVRLTVKLSDRILDLSSMQLHSHIVNKHACIASYIF